MTKAKILVVEDDPNIGFILKDNLELKGYEVQLCTDGDVGLKKFNENEFDLCLLDIMLPKSDGFSLAAEIRKENQNIPILFLSAKSLKEDRIQGFKTGADDYITKPFCLEELFLRIEVFLKRSNKTTDKKNFALGKFSFDYKNLLLHHKDGTMVLTQKEADVLKVFCEEVNQVVKREMILKKIWGDDDYFMGRSLDVFISRLRKYLKSDSSIEIVNIHGIGFKLKIEEL